MLKLHDFLDLHKKLFFWNKVIAHLTEKWEKIMQNITIFTMRMSRKLEVICVPLFIKFIRGDQYFPVSWLKSTSGKWKKNKMKSCVDNKIFNLIYFSTLYLSKPESFNNPLRQKWKVFFNCATKESILIWEILVQNIKRKILYALTCLIPILYWTQNSAVSDILLFEKVVCPELNCDHNFHKIFAQKIHAYKI